MRKTGLAYDPRCLLHDNGSMVLDEVAAGWLDVAHAENAARVRRAFQVLERSGVAARMERIEARPATRDELLAVHTDEHIDRIEAACEMGSLQWVGPEARVGGRSWGAALISAGSAISAVDFTMEGPSRPAYVLTRPPGHHASAGQAMGFCLFNNVAVAARHAQREHGLERVAILDWDVHHGNGTQAVFYDDPSVLFISIHQDGLYPADEGSIDERGSAEGTGTTVNIPMPAGSGDAGYLAAIDQVALPALAGFEPELVFISSGQDAAASDPLGRMSVTTEGFRMMAGRVSEFAESSCEGRFVALQEGGYSVDHMPFCVLATVEAMAGLEPSLRSDPIELDVPVVLGEAEAAAVSRAAAGR
ncbi:MAG TPA: class II histone deacetylase [Solirubrobacterales bacterium]|nr:class II histone deacetylase [Solirubrobacterales bacterium]